MYRNTSDRGSGSFMDVHITLEKREAFLEALQSLDLQRLAASTGVQNFSQHLNDRSRSFPELWNAKVSRMFERLIASISAGGKPRDA
jgi:hypothetical protein